MVLLKESVQQKKCSAKKVFSKKIQRKTREFVSDTLLLFIDCYRNRLSTLSKVQ